jgi:hypothetical protein
MNPYESPQVHDARTQEPHRRVWLIALVLIFSALFIIVGFEFALVQVGSIGAIQAEANRQKQAADAQAVRASEAAENSESQQKP